MKVLSFHIVLFLCICGYESQIQMMRPCPDYTVQQNFTLDQFLGKWYEVEKYEVPVEDEGKCIEHDFILSENDTIKMQLKMINTLSKKGDITDADAIYSDKIDEPKFILGLRLTYDYDYTPYWILETDYENYTVMWACNPVKGGAYFTYNTAWILARQRDPSEEILSKAHALFKRNPLNKHLLQKSDQTDS